MPCLPDATRAPFEAAQAATKTRPTTERRSYNGPAADQWRARMASAATTAGMGDEGWVQTREPS